MRQLLQAFSNWYYLWTVFGPELFEEKMEQSSNILLLTAFDSFVTTFISKEGIDASYHKWVLFTPDIERDTKVVVSKVFLTSIVLRSKLNISGIKWENTLTSLLLELKPVTDKIIYPIQKPRLKSINSGVFKFYFYFQFFYFNSW